MKILAFDISASPGVAVLEIKDGKPYLVYADSIKTDTRATDAQRYAYIEAFAVKTIHEHGPFDVVLREKYVGDSRSKRAKQLVFGAWAAIDLALAKYGYTIDEKEDEVVASQVKTLVGGKGNANKDEVEAGVRRLIKLPKGYKFKSNDASDAAAVALAWAMRKGLIESEK